MLVGLYGAGQKLWLQCTILNFLLERQMVLIIFSLSFYTNCLFFLILAEFFGYRSMVNVQITTDVLFKTYFVFDAQFACFDETINFYQWIKPWKSYITLDTMQKQNMNWFATVLRVVICLIILTDLTKFSVEVLCG